MENRETGTLRRWLSRNSHFLIARLHLACDNCRVIFWFTIFHLLPHTNSWNLHSSSVY